MSGEADSLPYVPLVEYNGTISTGGNSLTQDLNVFVSSFLTVMLVQKLRLIDVQYNAGDIAWVLTSTALVLLMIPGVGYVQTCRPPYLRSHLGLTVPKTDYFTRVLHAASPHSHSSSSRSCQ